MPWFSWCWAALLHRRAPPALPIPGTGHSAGYDSFSLVLLVDWDRLGRGLLVLGMGRGTDGKVICY